MRFAVMEIQSENIFRKVDSEIDLDQQIVHSAGSSNETRYIRIPDGADENHLVVLAGEDGLKYIEEDEDAKLEAQWASLRQERDSRLASCDWTQMPDSPLSVELKTDWAAYRQLLRDLPEETEDPSSPIWPEQP